MVLFNKDNTYTYTTDDAAFFDSATDPVLDDILFWTFEDEWQYWTQPPSFADSYSTLGSIQTANVGETGIIFMPLWSDPDGGNHPFYCIS